MLKRAIILLAIIGIIITGCSKKVVKSEDSISEDKGSLLTEDRPLEAVKDDAKSEEMAGDAKGQDGKEKSVEDKKAVKESGGKKEADSGDEYIIGAEDVLEIMVWRNEMLSRPRIVVRPDGRISLPLIGDIQAAGLTPNQLKDYIEKRLKDYQELPTVTVIVSEINSYYIYILGEVRSPGRYQLKSNISVLQAVTLAGGFTNWASPNSMVVLRRSGEKEEKIRVRYKKIISGSRPEENILMKPGDTIIIP